MYDVSVTYVPQRMALIARRRILAEQAGTVIPATFAELFEHIDSGGACGAEETLVIFPQDFGDPGEHEIAVVVTIADGVPGPGIELDELPGCQVVRTIHVGGYDTSAGWEAIAEWMDERDLEPAGGHWEVYRNHPGGADAAGEADGAGEAREAGEADGAGDADSASDAPKADGAEAVTELQQPLP